MFHGSPHAPCADQAKPSSRLPRSEATSVSCVLGIADHSATYNDPANHPRQREAAAALYKHIRPSRSHPDTSLTCGPGSLGARVRIPRKYALTCFVFNVRICVKYAKSRPHVVYHESTREQIPTTSWSPSPLSHRASDTAKPGMHGLRSTSLLCDDVFHRWQSYAWAILVCGLFVRSRSHHSRDLARWPLIRVRHIELASADMEAGHG